MMAQLPHRAELELIDIKNAKNYAFSKDAKKLMLRIAIVLCGLKITCDVMNPVEFHPGLPGVCVTPSNYGLLSGYIADF
jgi:hypothetical protein